MRTATAERSRLSFGSRIFLLVAAGIGLSILLSVVVAGLGASRIARRAVGRALSSSQMAQSAFQQQRRDHLRVMARSLALDPYVTAYAAEAEGTVYASSILHLLEQRRDDFDFGFAIVLDPHGRVLARTDRPGVGGEDLSSTPLVAEALQRGESYAVWQDGSTLYDAVALPLARESALFGYFVVGFPLDDGQALAVKRISGTDVAYLASTPAGPVVAASTLDTGVQAQLVEALRRRPAEGNGGDAPLELDLDDRRWIALVRPLQAGSDTGAGFTVALAPLDAELQAFRQIEKLLVGAGLVALSIACGLSYLLTRRTLRPVRRLAAAAVAARRGDYDQMVEPQGGDEVADLARTFNTLLADLREKRDMEAYIADLSRSLPAPAFETRAPAGRNADPPRPAAPGESTVPLARPDATGRDSVPPPSPTEEATLLGLSAGRLAAFAPGSVLGGRFEVLSLLGQGGMGIVLKALDRDLDEILALKVLRAEIGDDREMLERMKSELRLARKITHPNVLRTFDFLELDGIPCITMEYVHGVTLRSVLDRSGRLPYSAGLHLARQLGAGLAAAHAQGVIHRDIKPENLILQQNGNAKLMDFGIARPVRRIEPGQTRLGSVVGTPHYLAPEQLTAGDVDTRADIYAVGVLLYEVFTGALPFSGETAYEILVQHVQESPVPPSRYWPEIPKELELILLRCLERSPQNRWANVGELLEAIERVRGQSDVVQRA